MATEVAGHPWSVDEVLMFAIGKPDVLPVGDFGFRTAVKREFGLRKDSDKNRLVRISEAWRPYRSIATWYLVRRPQYQDE